MNSPGSVAARGVATPAARRYYLSLGGGGVIGRLAGLVCTLLIVAAEAGVFLLILGQVRPDSFEHIVSWFEQTF
jgi:hypothetical protein